MSIRKNKNGQKKKRRNGSSVGITPSKSNRHWVNFIHMSMFLIILTRGTLDIGTGTSISMNHSLQNCLFFFFHIVFHLFFKKMTSIIKTIKKND